MGKSATSRQDISPNMVSLEAYYMASCIETHQKLILTPINSQNFITPKNFGLFCKLIVTSMEWSHDMPFMAL